MCSILLLINIITIIMLIILCEKYVLVILGWPVSAANMGGFQAMNITGILQPWT